jgi:hypothetical protein
VSHAIATLIEDAIACVAAEVPQAYAAMERALGARRVELAIDDEHFMLDLGATALHGSVLSVVTDVETLCALVEGELGLFDAILADRLDIAASPDDVVAAASAMTCFVQGAMRCVSMQPLLDRLVALRKERTWRDIAVSSELSRCSEPASLA